MKNNQKILASIVLIAIFAFMGYLFVSKKSNIKEVIIPADWKTYKNEKYGFEFKYPGELVVYLETDNEIVFTNPKWPATSIPLPRVLFNIGLKDEPLSPNVGDLRNEEVIGLNESIDPNEILIKKNIVSKNPKIIEFVWKYEDKFQSTYSEYQIINDRNGVSDYFYPQGFGVKELPFSFKFFP